MLGPERLEAVRKGVETDRVSFETCLTLRIMLLYFPKPWHTRKDKSLWVPKTGDGQGPFLSAAMTGPGARI